MAELFTCSERRMLVDKYLTEVGLLAKQLCPAARIEATKESFEGEDGHVRIYPPAGLSEWHIEELEGKIAERCVDILVETGIFLCSALYEPDT